MPGAGLEPTSLTAGDFKSPVYTIPPPGQTLCHLRAPTPPRQTDCFSRRRGRSRSRVTKCSRMSTSCEHQVHHKSTSISNRYAQEIQVALDPTSLLLCNMLRLSILDARKAVCVLPRLKKIPQRDFLEAWARIELACRGFANHCLTTWLPRLYLILPLRFVANHCQLLFATWLPRLVRNI